MLSDSNRGGKKEQNAVKEISLPYLDPAISYVSGWSTPHEHTHILNNGQNLQHFALLEVDAVIWVIGKVTTLNV